MEIVIVIIIAVCILMAWGPRVLLAIIVAIPVIVFGMAWIMIQRQEVESAKYEKAQAELAEKTLADQIAKGIDPWAKYNLQPPVRP